VRKHPDIDIGTEMSGNNNNEIRFAFGKNWRYFLSTVNEHRISSARESLLGMLGVESLQGACFLDVGCGSGLFSLAARKEGAVVRSFDYDKDSVECTNVLRTKFFPDDANWCVGQGSILDKTFVKGLGTYDIVYSWGVLHHTGNMWEAMQNVPALLSSKGKLYLSLYNDQGLISSYWTTIKKHYNNHPWTRPVLKLVFSPYFVGARYLVRLAGGRVRLERGMSYWYDMIDWLGGYPFEVAKPGKVISYFENRDLVLKRVVTCGRRSGCNEYLFENPG